MLKKFSLLIVLLMLASCAAVLHPYRTPREKCYTFAARNIIEANTAFYLGVFNLWDSPILYEAGTQWEVRFGSYPNWIEESVIYAYVDDWQLAVLIPSKCKGKKAALKSHDGKCWYNPEGRISSYDDHGRREDITPIKLDEMAVVINENNFVLITPNDPDYNSILNYFENLQMKLSVWNFMTPSQINDIKRLDTYDESRIINILSSLSIIPALYNSDLWSESWYKSWRTLAEINNAKQNFKIYLDNSVYGETKASQYDVVRIMSVRDAIKWEEIRRERGDKNFLKEIYDVRRREGRK